MKFDYPLIFLLMSKIRSHTSQNVHFSAVIPLSQLGLCPSNGTHWVGGRPVDRQLDKVNDLDLILTVWLVCVDHPFLLPHALTPCFTMRLFFCSFYPCSAADGRPENQGLSLCLQHGPRAQHRVTCVLCISMHLAVPLHLLHL